VKAHLSSAFQRIGVADRTSAALWARDNLRAGPEDDRGPRGGDPRSGSA
jgi:hypothetical protein